MAVCRGRTADIRATGMLTSPNVIVPDHIERTGAPALSLSAEPPSCERLGNFLLLRGRNAGAQAFCETCRRRLPAGLDRLELFAARLCLDQLAQALPILVLPRRRVEVARDRSDQLLCELEFAGRRRGRLAGLDA